MLDNAVSHPCPCGYKLEFSTSRMAVFSRLALFILPHHVFSSTASRSPLPEGAKRQEQAPALRGGKCAKRGMSGRHPLRGWTVVNRRGRPPGVPKKGTAGDKALSQATRRNRKCTYAFSSTASRSPLPEGAKRQEQACPTRGYMCKMRDVEAPSPTRMEHHKQ